MLHARQAGPTKAFPAFPEMDRWTGGTRSMLRGSKRGWDAKLIDSKDRRRGRVGSRAGGDVFWCAFCAVSSCEFQFYQSFLFFSTGEISFSKRNLEGRMSALEASKSNEGWQDRRLFCYTFDVLFIPPWLIWPPIRWVLHRLIEIL